MTSGSTPCRCAIRVVTWDALTDVSLNIPAGRRVAFCWRLGQRQKYSDGTSPALPAQQGDVLIDGKPVAQLGLRTVRDNLALVSQDVLLVNDTVTANIAFGVEPAAVDGNRVHWQPQRQVPTPLSARCRQATTHR